jgi:hypothetical protein
MASLCENFVPRAFSLVVGALAVAEGVKLTTGMYLVMFIQTSEIMYMNEDQMCASIETGAKLVWSDK